MRLLVRHRSRYRYPAPAALGPHVIRLRPCDHVRAGVETYQLTIAGPHQLHWQRDPHGNHVARVTTKVGDRIDVLDVLVELAIELRAVNPFDFLVDPRCKTIPFAYPDGLAGELAPFLAADDPALAIGPRARAFIAELPADGDVIDAVVEINRRVAERVRYVVREEAGVWTPEQTLTEGRGSCRDAAALLCAALRARGLAARFVSGYLVQITDEGMLPDQPRGLDRDVVDLHAWAEVFVPGAGWIGLDATSGLLAGEGHLALAATASPAAAAPIEGTSDVVAGAVEFTTSVTRLGHEPRPTSPYPDLVWTALLDAADAADAALTGAGLTVTSGGEPTFTSREHPSLPEWNAGAVGPSKWAQGLRLADALTARLAPGAAIVHRLGKQYPDEPLPRWSLDVCARRDGVEIWPHRALPVVVTAAAAERLARAVADELAATAPQPVFEDPWPLLAGEAALPIDRPPPAPLELRDLGDASARRRLARALDLGAGAPAGWVLPLTRAAGAWVTEAWTTRRDHLFLIPGDAPAGLRLPLASLAPGAPAPTPPALDPLDPRALPTEDGDDDASAARTQLRLDASDHGRARLGAVPPPPPPAGPDGVRTALVVEARAGALWVFLPPVARFDDWLALVAAVDRARVAVDAAVRLEGYPPPSDPGLARFAVTPDPGVLEVNLPPAAGGRAHAELLQATFDAALASGLTAEKYLLDGRLTGSGGGHHVTIGGPTPATSPWLVRPDLLASLVTACQHHPALSYLFTGLFIGPTSQAPRVDESRPDVHGDLDLALARLARGPTPPWLCDALLRHYLCDVAGSTHRAELSIDKLCDPGTPFGRQGLVELRAFEMPPHPRLAAAQVILVRALVAAFARAPYRRPLVRWGAALHDRFLLPYFLGADLELLLAELAERGVALPSAAYAPFVELRCPLAGQISAGGVTLEVRNALEPWPVLGQEVTATGTARFVDSSFERLELRALGLTPERHAVTVNGVEAPLTPAAPGVHVAGVRFRAWCPPHARLPHLGIHHPLAIALIDRADRRALGAGTYHVWHPEGRGFEAPPLTRFEATARRARRFTRDGLPPTPAPITAPPLDRDRAVTLDLCATELDRPLDHAGDWAGPYGEAPR
ncbi:MAG: transglutaminase family protein [Myxococcales bacterium]|nr:transglutaminase family protein [Myxococcales bacterium]